MLSWSKIRFTALLLSLFIVACGGAGGSGDGDGDGTTGSGDGDDTTVLNAPTGLTATPGTTWIDLSWTAVSASLSSLASRGLLASSSAEIIGYWIYYRDGSLAGLTGTDFTDSDGVPTYKDTFLTSATEYCYTVKTYYDNAELSDASAEVCATTEAADEVSSGSSNSGGSSSTASGPAAWTLTDVFDGGGVGTVRCSGLGVDSNGKGHIAFINDTSPSIGSNYDYWLRYTTNVGGSWAITDSIEASTDSRCLNVSVAMDSSDNVHVAYEIEDGIRYSTNASGSWVATTIYDHSGESGYLFGPSLAIDSSGFVHISYSDRSPQGRTGFSDLIYVTNASGAWVDETVDSVEGTYGDDNNIFYPDCFSSPSIALSPDDTPYIAYYDCTNDYLKRARKVSGSWIRNYVVAVDSDDGTHMPSIGIDSADSIHISYLDNDLYYVSNSTGTWLRTLISDSPFSAASSNSLTIDSNNKVHMVYAAGAGSPDFYYASNSTGTWLTETVDTSGATGYYGSISVDSSGTQYVSYKRNDGILKYGTR